MLAEITGANEKYTTKCGHSVHNLKVIRTCLARGNIFENVGFPKETRENLPFIKKYAKASKFSYVQIFLKSSLLNVVKDCIWFLLSRKDSMKVNLMNL